MLKFIKDYLFSWFDWLNEEFDNFDLRDSMEEPRLEIQIFKDAREEYRWRLVSTGNHKILASSSESYKTKQGLNKTLDLIKKEFPRE